MELPNAHFCDFCKPDSDLVVKLKALIVNPPVFQQSTMSLEDDSDLYNIANLMEN